MRWARRVKPTNGKDVEDPKSESEPEDRGRHYESPSEVMKKKGCISCSVMLLGLMLMVASAVALLVMS